jgi:hypothetical protein
MNNCIKCNEPVHGNYCSSCGYPVELKKIDGRYILNEIGDVFLVNSGMFYTIKSLITKPGKTVRHFITEDRSQCVRPITFLVVTSLFYAIVNYFFHIEMKDNTFDVNLFFDIKVEGLPTAIFIFGWMTENFAYSGILTGLFMALGVKIFFRKADYNLFEIFVLICFVSGISTLFITVSTIIQSITHLNLRGISSIITLVYFIWATGQFFGMKKAGSYIKSLLSYFFGILIFASIIVLVSFLIDFVIYIIK